MRVSPDPVADELRQLEAYLDGQKITEPASAVASSLGADLACTFLVQTSLTVYHAFFDGGQFARIGKVTRHIMVPFLYLTIKSLYWSKGRTLKKILWCDDDAIKPYFVAAGKTPPQNRSVTGFDYAPKRRKPRFQAAFGHRKSPP